MSCDLKIRKALPKDMELINAYAYSEGMDRIDDADGIDVAVDAEDVPVGFIRIVQDQNGISHIYPIVIYEPWRGYGVGRMLIEDAYSEFGELRLVSRGSSKGFYDKLGFEECDWSLIGEGLSEDCPNCSFRDECDPAPMRKL